MLTKREAAAVAAPIHSMRLVTYERDPDSPGQTLELDSEHESVADFLAEHDIVVNCMLQDTDAPLILVSNRELERFPRGRSSSTSPRTKEWASSGHGPRPSRTRCSGSATGCAATRSTTARRCSGIRPPGRSARRSCPYLPAGLSGPRSWAADPTISRAIEIRDGVIQNPKILSFQGRSAEYPHERGSST